MNDPEAEVRWRELRFWLSGQWNRAVLNEWMDTELNDLFLHLNLTSFHNNDSNCQKRRQSYIFVQSHRVQTRNLLSDHSLFPRQHIQILRKDCDVEKEHVDVCNRYSWEAQDYEFKMRYAFENRNEKIYMVTIRGIFPMMAIFNAMFTNIYDIASYYFSFSFFHTPQANRQEDFQRRDKHTDPKFEFQIGWSLKVLLGLWMVKLHEHFRNRIPSL